VRSADPADPVSVGYSLSADSADGFTTQLDNSGRL